MSRRKQAHSDHFFGHGVADPLSAPEIGSDRLTHVHPNDLDAFLSRRSHRMTLSFDDGYADNLITALPILERHQQPATVFVTTGFVERNAVLLARVAASAACSPRSDGPAIRGLIDPSTLDSTGIYVGLRNRLKQMSVAQRHAHHAELMAECGIGPADLTDDYINREQLAALDAHPLITIGVHTRTHPDLRYCSDSELDDELAGAKEILESWVEHTVDTLAYPFGDTDARVRRAAKSAGYTRAYVTEKPNWRSHVPMYGRLDIPRVDLSGEVRRMRRRERKDAAAGETTRPS